MIIKPGDLAPTFEFTTENGELIKTNEFKSKNNIILYFYPKDDTPGCTIEAKDFRDKIKEFTELNTVIIGISKDDMNSHKNFKKKHCLPFDLVSDSGFDEGLSIAQKYGVWIEKKMFNKTYMGMERATFFIDKEGIIKKVWHNVKVNGHVESVLESVKEMALETAK